MSNYALDDLSYMSNAIDLADRGLGVSGFNPSVGCVIVNNDRIVGRGWTQPGGRPHAEIEALRRAGDRSYGSKVYVTLEPCCHHGVSGPCTQALIDNGVKKVFVAVIDPDERVKGKGIEALKKAGVEVEVGILEDSARKLNKGFFKKIEKGLPFFALKSALSIDGNIALSSGKSKWLTSNLARQYSHLLRATHDAIIVGSGTILSDDPELNCRLPGYEISDNQPIKIVLDRRLRIDPKSKIFSSSKRIWLITSPNSDSDKVHEIKKSGGEVFFIDGKNNNQFICSVATFLAQKGLNRVIIEGGAKVGTSFLRNSLIDRLYIFKAPKILGSDGVSFIGKLNFDSLSSAYRFERVSTTFLDMDTLEIFDSIMES